MPADHSSVPARPVYPITGHLVMAALFPDEEIWAPVPDYPGYEVSSKARIRSFWIAGNRVGRSKQSLIADSPQRYLSPQVTRGHLCVKLSRDGKGPLRQIAVWMMLAFVGPCPEGMECCHGDGNPANNDLSNLRWDTRSSNTVDSIRHKTHHLTKFSEADVLAIRERASGGEHPDSIAREFGTNRQQVNRIIFGKRWSFLGGPISKPKPHRLLTEAVIPDIRSRLAAGESCPSIARDYCVSPKTIMNIKLGVRWAHVP